VAAAIDRAVGEECLAHNVEVHNVEVLTVNLGYPPKGTEYPFRY
jgi:hypothetical protein